MTTTIEHSDRGVADRSVRVVTRSPTFAAVLSALTLTLYGFWWWWDLNRQLRRRGEDAHPWRALTAVTVGWLAILPPFRSVRDTTRAIASAQGRARLQPTASTPTALRLAISAAVGLVLFGTSIFFPPGVLIFGWIPPGFGMAFVYYEQREFNRAVGT